MADRTSNLILSLVDRITGPARQVTSTLSRLQAASRANAERLQAMNSQMLGALGAGYALYRGLSAPIEAARRFESSMANVSTLVDTSTESMVEMGRAVREIATRTPVAMQDLTAALYDIRSAGIAAGEAMGVLEGSARLAVAGLGTTNEAQNLVTSAINAFNIRGEEQARIYDVIFKTVRNGKTNISQLAQGFGAVAGTVANAGVELDEYLASVAALTTTGLPAAQAHTQIRAAIAGLTRETAGSRRIFAQLGATNLKDLIDQTGGLVPALDRIRRAAGDDASLLRLVGSVEAMNAILGLTGAQAEAYATTLHDMRNGANAVDEAFQKQAETSDGMRQVFANNIEALNTAIGNALIPSLNAATEAAVSVVRPITDLAERFPAATRAVVGLAAGIVAFRVATIAGQWSFLFLKQGFLDIGVAALRGGAMVRRGFIAVRAAFVGAQMLATVYGAGIVAKIGAIKAALLAITAPIWGTVALIVAAIAIVAVAIHRYWEPISNFVAGFAEEIAAAVEPMITYLAELPGRLAAFATDRIIDVATWLGLDEETVRAAIDTATATIAAGIDSIVGIVRSVVGAVGDFFSDLFSMKDYSDEQEEEFREAGRAAARALIDGISTAAAMIVQLGAELGAGLGRAILDGLKTMGSAIRDWFLSIIPDFARGFFNLDTPAIAGARAEGGPVSAGRSYLVGEEGPEIFTAGASGFVSPNEVYRGMEAARASRSTAGGSAPGRVYHDNRVFNLTVNARTNASADEIGRAVGDQVRRAVDGSFSDGAL